MLQTALIRHSWTHLRHKLGRNPAARHHEGGGCACGLPWMWTLGTYLERLTLSLKLEYAPRARACARYGV
jgi:hypothetical protein